MFIQCLNRVSSIEKRESSMYVASHDFLAADLAGGRHRPNSAVGYNVEGYTSFRIKKMHYQYLVSIA